MSYGEHLSILGRASLVFTNASDQAVMQHTVFQAFDGMWAENVILQIKNGPFDFQIREPVDVLFNTLGRTTMALELEAKQEYTGQNRSIVFLPSQWHYYLKFDMGMRKTI